MYKEREKEKERRWQPLFIWSRLLLTPLQIRSLMCTVGHISAYHQARDLQSRVNYDFYRERLNEEARRNQEE